MNNSEKLKRFYASVLLSFSILLVGKNIDKQLENSKYTQQDSDNPISYEVNFNNDEYKELIDYQKDFINSFGLEKTRYSSEEIDELLRDGTVITKQYGNSPFLVYCIEIKSARSSSGVVYAVPNGYKRYAQLVAIETNVNGERKIYYDVTSIIRTEKVEQKDNIRTRRK